MRGSSNGMPSARLGTDPVAMRMTSPSTSRAVPPPGAVTRTVCGSWNCALPWTSSILCRSMFARTTSRSARETSWRRYMKSGTSSVSLIE